MYEHLLPLALLLEQHPTAASAVVVHDMPPPPPRHTLIDAEATSLNAINHDAAASAQSRGRGSHRVEDLSESPSYQQIKLDCFSLFPSPSYFLSVSHEERERESTDRCTRHNESPRAATSTHSLGDYRPANAAVVSRCRGVRSFSFFFSFFF